MQPHAGVVLVVSPSCVWQPVAPSLCQGLLPSFMAILGPIAAASATAAGVPPVRLCHCTCSTCGLLSVELVVAAAGQVADIQ